MAYSPQRDVPRSELPELPPQSRLSKILWAIPQVVVGGVFAFGALASQPDLSRAGIARAAERSSARVKPGASPERALQAESWDVGSITVPCGLAAPAINCQANSWDTTGRPRGTGWAPWGGGEAG
jgi:hypothetical protein